MAECHKCNLTATSMHHLMTIVTGPSEGRLGVYFSYLRGTSDHVLDEITMTGRVDDCDVVLGRFKLPQRNVDRDTTLALSFQLVQNPGVFERTFAHLQCNAQSLTAF